MILICALTLFLTGCLSGAPLPGEEIPEPAPEEEQRGYQGAISEREDWSAAETTDISITAVKATDGSCTGPDRMVPAKGESALRWWNVSTS